MIVLALDTTTRAGSVAVVRDGAVVYEAEGDAGLTHGQRLPADLARAMEVTGLRIREVELFAVAAGPGSFTGLRVGIATVQGLAMAYGRRVVPVSVLDALAHSGAGRAPQVGAWMDAQRGQVFAALYDAEGTSITSATALTPDETLEAWRPLCRPGDTVFFVGDGAMRYAAVIRREAGGQALIGAPPMLAPIVGRLAGGAAATAVLPHAIVPIYVRRPDAELARDRRQAGGP